MVAKLKLKGIDGRAPQEMEPAVAIERSWRADVSDLSSAAKERNRENSKQREAMCQSASVTRSE